MIKKGFQLENEYKKFYLPGVLVLISLGILPILFLFVMSFYRLTLGNPWINAKFVGLYNWAWMFTNPQMEVFKALGKTLIFSLGSVTFECLLGVTIATFLNRKLKGANFIATVLIIPTVMTPSMVGMVWRLYFTDNSIVDFLFNYFFHLNINWMSAKMAMISLISVSVWQYTPFWIITLLAAMKLLPGSPFEAAIVDGATEWQRFKYLLLPYISPIIMLVLVLRFVQNFIGFDMIFALTGGGPGTVTEVLSLYIYRLNFFNKAVGPGAASSFFLLIIVAVISYLMVKVLPNEEIQ